MKKSYNKLVRDNIPEIIESSGKKCKTYILDDFMFEVALSSKLEEETRELKISMHKGNISEIVQELADVYEILEAMQELCGLDYKTINIIKNEKAIRNGKFRKCIFLESVEDNE